MGEHIVRPTSSLGCISTESVSLDRELSSAARRTRPRGSAPSSALTTRKSAERGAWSDRLTQQRIIGTGSEGPHNEERSEQVRQTRLARTRARDEAIRLPRTLRLVPC